MFLMESHEYRYSYSHYTVFHSHNPQMIYYLKYKVSISSVSNIQKPEYNFKLKISNVQILRRFRLSTPLSHESYVTLPSLNLLLCLHFLFVFQHVLLYAMKM